MLNRFKRLLAGTLLAFTLLPAAGAHAADSALLSGAGFPGYDPTPDGRFGGIQVSDVPMANAKDLGVSWTREQFLLNLLPGLDPSKFRTISTDQNMPASSIREVGLLNFFPSYCSGNPDKMVPCAGLDQPWNSSANPFGQLVNSLAKAKQGKIDTWILYNEPDICAGGQAGYAWNSANRVQDYYNYVKTGYPAIKAASPGATVVFGSIGITNPACQDNGDEMTFFNQWLDIGSHDPAAGPNGWWFDQLSLNIHKEPEKIYDLLRRYHEAMQAHGFDKSTWIMEMGIPVQPGPVDPNTNGDLDVDKGGQQSFLIQAYANAIAGGADHVGIYKMSDFPPSDPAYKTIKTAIKYMSHVSSAVKSPENRTSSSNRYVDRLSGVVTVTMQGPGFQTVVAYNRGTSPASATIPATSGSAWLADKNGNEQQITPQNGAYTIPLEPVASLFNAPWGEQVRFIGGSPMMLRQAA